MKLLKKLLKQSILNKTDHLYKRIEIYPNPVVDKLHIVSNTNEQLVVKVLDVRGKLVAEKTLSPLDKTTIDVEQLAKGNYTAVFYQNGEIRLSKGFVKE